MRFNHLDLNLLVALDVLLEEQNITRAAERLHMTQSATSGVLGRLRLYFEDELLAQVGRKIATHALCPRTGGARAPGAADDPVLDHRQTGVRSGHQQAPFSLDHL